MAIGLCWSPAAHSDWWDQRWSARLAVTLEGVGHPIQGMPIQISGRALKAAIGPLPAWVSSFRVVGPEGRLRPSQVDERDETGVFQRFPNRMLDDDDELVFQANLPPRGAIVYYIYFGDNPSRAPQTAGRRAFRRSGPLLYNANYDAMLESAGLVVGIKGPGLKDRAASNIYNYGRGSITHLSWRGTPMLSQGDRWDFYFLKHPFESPPPSLDWGPTDLVVDGPVRRVAAVRLPGFQRRTDSGGIDLAADVHHEFAVYSELPALDITETLTHCSGDLSRRLNYTVEMAPGGTCDTEDALYWPDGTTATVIPLKGMARPAGSWLTLAESRSPAEHWFAWRDQARAHGMAVFYHGLEPQVSIAMNVRAVWKDYVQAESTGLNTISLIPVKLSGSSAQVRFRVWGIGGESPEVVQASWRAWARYRDLPNKALRLERRPG